MFIDLIFPVCHPTSNAACNVFGIQECADVSGEKSCVCKKGYTGKFCEKCNFLNSFYVLRGIEGRVTIGGDSVTCTGSMK